MINRALCCLGLLMWTATVQADFKAGTAIVDVTPRTFPVLVNGGMLSRSISVVRTPLNARAIVLDDGDHRIAIVVVDSCMMPRPLLDEAKELASKMTAIKPECMLVSATHTHTAGSCMGALGTDADPEYSLYLTDKIAEAIVAAEKNLQPAEVGWGLQGAPEFTALRRWIRRPDRKINDPFGNLTVRANMHSGRNWDDVTGESGPEDPDLSLISIRTKDHKAIGVLANFSMHYFSDRDISADYFGLFSEGFRERLIEAGLAADGFVGMMSHGCSGDIWRRDYKVEAPPEPKIDEYANGLLDIALEAYGAIKYSSDITLDMAERRMTLDYRLPDMQRLEWAQRIVKEMGDRLPKTTEEVYAREQVILHEAKSTEIVVQAMRIGDIAIATTPNETYALTGLKIKAHSPLKNTMVIELANGGDGYIPPPEQHLLGGYNTWAARSAGLEVQAEPKIVETAIQLLEQVTGKHRRPWKQSTGPLVSKTLELKPIAYWRLDEMAGPEAFDSSSNRHHAIHEPETAYFLDGPHSQEFCTEGEVNRCIHLAGGRLRAQLSEPKNDYSISLWCWNGMPAEARDVTGWLLSRSRDHSVDAFGDHFGLSGGSEKPSRLIYRHGREDKQQAMGQTEVPRWTWNHVALVRKGKQVQVYLNGLLEFEVVAAANFPEQYGQFLFGGRGDGDSGWEGRLDEISVYDRALTEEEVQQLVVTPAATAAK